MTFINSMTAATVIAVLLMAPGTAASQTTEQSPPTQSSQPPRDPSEGPLIQPQPFWTARHVAIIAGYAAAIGMGALALSKEHDLRAQRRAIETLEGEVRALSERIDRSRQAGAEGESLAAVEHELAEVRNALHHLTPAENLVGFEDAVRALSNKIDTIAQGAIQGTGDPLAFKQLEQAVKNL